MSALTITLDQIVGRSPLNVRSEVGGDVSDLVASIPVVGVLQPIILRDDGRGWEALDGGRRLDALWILRDKGKIPADYNTPVLFDTRPEAEAREVSLAANVIRRNLHPVEEFEAFARLNACGFDVDRIAADFNVEARFVRQRLALDKLSPTVRDHWRRGDLTADAAAAFTIAPNHAAQDAFLADPARAHPNWRTKLAVREHFTRTAKPANSREALYVGLDAYGAAGGTVDDNLFEEFSLCLDGELLDRLAREKLQAEGEALMDRYGYGFVVFRDGVERSWDWTRQPIDRTEAERARLVEIEAAEVEAGDNAESLQVLEAERRKIESRAVTRGTTAAERAQAGVMVSLSQKGTLIAELGQVPPKRDKTERVITNPKVADMPAPAAAPKAEDAPAEERKPGKALIECIDAARSAALASLVAERPYLAILIATAALAASHQRSPVRIEAGMRSPDVHALERDFTPSATRLLRAASDRDSLLVHFARTIASTIVVRPEKTYGHQHNAATADPTDTLALCELVAAYSGDAYEPAMRRALDYAAYFAAATRDAAISALTEAAGDVNHARTLKKAELAAYVATFARDQEWLPRELRRPAALPVDHPHATPVLTLAEAMADALARDGALPAEDPGTGEAPEGDDGTKADAGVYTVTDFLYEASTTTPGASIKASDLYAVYKARLGNRAAEVDKVQTFSTAVVAFGIDKKRRADGVYFVDLALADQASEAA